MARGPSAERIMRHGTPTGMQPGARRPSRDNAPYATGGSMNQYPQGRPMGNYGGGPKIATTNTRL